MRFQISVATALLALVQSPVALAAQDSGYVATSALPVAGGHAIGAQLGLRVKFGDRKTAPAAEKIRLGIAAGPIISYRAQRSSLGYRQSQPSFAGLSLVPGRSLSLTLAGQPLATHYTALGAAEQGDGEGKKDRKGPSTLGWVAIGVAALVVVTVAAAAIALSDLCYECEN
jgi:hypothetical protein